MRCVAYRVFFDVQEFRDGCGKIRSLFVVAGLKIANGVVPRILCVNGIPSVLGWVLGWEFNSVACAIERDPFASSLGTVAAGRFIWLV